MTRTAAIEVTFLSAGDGSAVELLPAEGVVRMPDDSLRAFSGWIDLLALLELVASSVQGAGSNEPR